MRIEFYEDYAIADTYITKKANLKLFDYMKKKGYDLVQYKFLIAIFKKIK